MLSRSEGASKLEKAKFTVLNEALIKKCIYVPPSGAEEEKKSRDREQKTMQNQAIDFHEVECLMFSFTGIYQIDNLAGFDCLTKLQLDNNEIEQINNLHHLTKLVWLDLSFNKITKIQGLEKLTLLQDLTLHCNKIERLENMDEMKELRCLSIGKNLLGSQGQDVDDIARYLRRFKNLKMLSLAGNPVVEKMNTTAYENKLLAHLGGDPSVPGSGLKYLDYRLVNSQRVRDAKEEHRETVIQNQDVDKKQQISDDQLRHRSTEIQELKDCNCWDMTNDMPIKTLPSIEGVPGIAEAVPPIHGLFDAMVTEGTDAKTLRDFEEYDDARLLVGERDEYNKKFQTRVEEFCSAMSKRRDAKREEITMFNKCIEGDTVLHDLEAKDMIKVFEKKKKRIMPAHDGHPTEEELQRMSEEGFQGQLQELDFDLGKLKENLLERETDQQEAYDAVISEFENAMNILRDQTVDVVQEFFKELRDMEDEYRDKMAGCFETIKTKSAGRTGVAAAAAEGHPNLDGTDDGVDNTTHNRQRLEGILDNKEELEKLVEESHLYRQTKIYAMEEKLQKQEMDGMTDLIVKVKDTEHTRNRKRVCEIIMYCQLVKQLIRMDLLDPEDGDGMGGGGYRHTGFSDGR